ncbi:mitochondrial thiamine pyrophosphate transporter [Dimargaris verticillata]|uniref:Mitochondrial thiamine pyrophosphate transporter n=1 Tax=Dimargaris verticillata TaxID=2761393 RepID=A0A9W8BAR5_9FUNG|nr:mitochondrial thiamine pyrophosphate transporter [Dimargaris verticillata]
MAESGPDRASSSNSTPPSANNRGLVQDVQLSPAQHALCGGVAGVVSRFVIAPLDVFKIHLQLQTIPQQRPWKRQPPSHGVPSEMWAFMAHTLRHEGVKGLWKGNLSAEYLYLTYGAIQFLSYSELEKSLQSTHVASPSATSFTCGMLTGMIATWISYPFDLMRTRFAAQSSVKVYNGLMHGMTTIYRTEGIRGFYQGIWPSLVQVMPYFSLMFGTYDFFTRSFNSLKAASAFTPEPLHRRFVRRAEPFQDAICGGLAGVVSKTGVFPLDLVRKRMQVQGPSRKYFGHDAVPQYQTSITQTIRQIVKHEGVLGLYRGIVPGLIKSAPASAATFFIYGQMKRLCHDYNTYA